MIAHPGAPAEYDDDEEEEEEDDRERQASYSDAADLRSPDAYASLPRARRRYSVDPGSWARTEGTDGVRSGSSSGNSSSSGSGGSIGISGSGSAEGGGVTGG